MKINRDELARDLASLSDDQLRQVADYIAFLRFNERRAVLAPMDERIAALYRDYADRDRTLANAGLTEYRDALGDEDRE